MSRRRRGQDAPRLDDDNIVGESEATKKVQRTWRVRLNMLTTVIHDENYQPVEEHINELNKIRETLDKYNNIRAEQFTGEDGEWEKEMNEQFSCVMTICAAIERVKKRLSSDQTASSSASVVKKVEPTYTARLPKLEIPKFDGDFSKWRTFSSLFDTTVHKNPHLSDTVKFVYLKSHLVEPAATDVAGLEETDENYKIALQLLREKYGRTDYARNVYLKNLYEIKGTRSLTDLPGLRRALECVVKNLTALDSLGVDRGTYAQSVYCKVAQAVPSFLVYEVVEKIGKPSRTSTPDATLEEQFAGLSAKFEEKSIGDYPEKLQAIIDGLRERVRICEEVNADASLQGDASKPREEKSRDEKPRLSHDKREKKSEQSRDKQPSIVFRTSAKSACIFCRGEHRSANCRDSKTSASDKRQIVRDQRVCFFCCEDTHFARHCKAEPPSCGKCNAKHLTILHLGERRIASKAESPATDKVVVSKISSIRGAPYKETAFAYALNRGTRRSVRLLLDTCSDRTFILRSTADKLRLKSIGEETLEIDTFGCKNVAVRTYQRVLVQLSHMGRNASIRVEALVTETIDQTPEAYPHLSKEISEKLRKMRCWTGDRAQGDSVQPIDLLVGCDYLPHVYKANSVKRIGAALLARETIFAWVVLGSEEDNKFAPTITVARVAALHRSSPESMWSLEAIGVDASELTRDKEQLQLANFVKHVRYEQGQYAVAIPVKNSIVDLHDNFDIARVRLEKRLAVLQRSQSAFNMYDREMAKFVENDFTERVPAAELQLDGPKFFMPHHAVTRETSSTTPIRIVFDCASHGPGRRCLNDSIETGPNIQQNLVDVLLRFRQHRVGLTADVSKAFLRILLHAEHRDLFRYLWIDGKTVTQYRFRTLPFGCNASPYLLTATLQHHLDRQPTTEVTEKLKRCFYVDDMVTGCDTLESARELKAAAVRTLADAGMTLGKWASNADQLCDASTTEADTTSVLGYAWQRKKDAIMYHVSTFDKNDKQITKRQLLSLISRMFDPLGLLAPYTCTAKQLFQETWKTATHWNEKISDEITARFNAWVQQIDVVAKIEIPRWYGDWKTADRVELHVFADFAPRAYATIAYLRIISQNQVRVVPVISRHRLSPLNAKLTVPRGELMAALIAARIGRYVRETLTLPVDATHFWSDSWIALCWIRGQADRWSPFVANRVAEIQTLTATDTWRHCPGAENPADLATRGVSAEALKECKLWWTGPSFLQQMDADWPDLEVLSLHAEDQVLVDAEQRPIRATVRCAMNTEQRVLQFERFGKLSTVLNICENVRKFISAATQRSSIPRLRDVSAMTIMLRCIQHESLHNVVDAVRKEQPAPNTSKLRQYQLMLSDDGLLRIKTRLSADVFSFEDCNPAVLMPDHPGVKLIVAESHHRLMHGGVSAMMADLRRHLFIVNCRSMCRKEVAMCTTCRRYRPRAADDLFAPIPADRLEATRPFERVGVDFFGPILVTEEGAMKKVYVALFTCLVVRAVHLELVHGLTTPQFIDAFRRFIARRRVPAVVHSDNAQTFVKSRSEISQLYRNIISEDVTNFTRSKAIQWKFSVPYAPWTGGSWERMVKTVKMPLRKVVGRARLTAEQLQTVLLEAEAVVNTRPLVSPTSDVDEHLALTPAHFLYGGPDIMLPSDHPSRLPEMFRRREQTMTAIWKRFREEYIGYLRNMHENGRRIHDVRQGQLVIVDETPAPRCVWRLGIIDEVFTGRDGYVRSAVVRMPNQSTLRRAVRHLIPLEIQEDQRAGGQAVAAQTKTDEARELKCDDTSENRATPRSSPTSSSSPRLRQQGLRGARRQ